MNQNISSFHTKKNIIDGWTYRKDSIVGDRGGEGTFPPLMGGGITPSEGRGHPPPLRGGEISPSPVFYNNSIMVKGRVPKNGVSL